MIALQQAISSTRAAVVQAKLIDKTPLGSKHASLLVSARTNLASALEQLEIIKEILEYVPSED